MGSTPFSIRQQGQRCYRANLDSHSSSSSIRRTPYSTMKSKSLSLTSNVDRLLSSKLNRRNSSEAAISLRRGFSSNLQFSELNRLIQFPLVTKERSLFLRI